MAKFMLILEDDEDTENSGEEGMNVRYHFEPPPLTTDEEQAELVTVAQDHGMFIVEHLLGKPLNDDDFMEPTFH